MPESRQDGRRRRDHETRRRRVDWRQGKTVSGLTEGKKNPEPSNVVYSERLRISLCLVGKYLPLDRGIMFWCVFVQQHHNSHVVWAPVLTVCFYFQVSPRTLTASTRLLRDSHQTQWHSLFNPDSLSCYLESQTSHPLTSAFHSTPLLGSRPSFLCPVWLTLLPGGLRPKSRMPSDLNPTQVIALASGGQQWRTSQGSSSSMFCLFPWQGNSPSTCWS